MSTLHQLLAGFSNGDAISNEAIVFQRIFRSWGLSSDIYTETSRVLPELRSRIHDIAELTERVDENDVVLLHLSTGSRVNQMFADLPCRKAMLYHNVTPAAYMEWANKQVANTLVAGRKQVKALASSPHLAMAASQYNASELLAAGYHDVRVLPLVIDVDAVKTRADRSTLKRFSDGRTNILFVGRGAPNKKIEDLLKVLSHYRNAVDADARLIHVGSWAGMEPYRCMVDGIIKELRIDDGVHFAGPVSQSELAAYYECSDMFLCMSEHEGFCIPLLESMMHDLPVLAHASAAIPETMDGAGILVQTRDMPVIVELMARVISDQPLRDAVIRGQQERLARYRSRDLEQELRTHLAPLLETGS